MKDTEVKGDNIVKIDLTNYARVGDVVNKIELEALKQSITVKANEGHKHSLTDVDELTQELNSKLSNNQRYSYSTLLSDSEKIPYLENVKIPLLELVKDRNTTGYKFTVDSTGDLHITYNSSVIASYVCSSNDWILSGINIKNTVNRIDDVLQNHYQAINLLANQHNITDSNTTDGSKFTTT